MKIRGLVLLLAAAALAAQTTDADVLLQRAIRKESVEGDLNGAIELYQRVIAGAAKNRGAAAKALLGLGECYEKQGNAEAQKTYERLVREFGDQAEPARQAQVRLATLGQARGSKSMMTQLIARGPELDLEGRVTVDGRLYAFVDQDTGNVAIRDLLTGAVRYLTNEGTGTANDDAHAHFPLPSHDAAQLAYCWYFHSAPTEDRMELRLINMDGSGMRRVPLHVANGASYELVDWMPDGKRVLAFGNDTRNGAPDSWTGFATIDVRTGEEHRISKDTHGHGPARLSGDGRWLVYSRPETAVDSWDVYALDTQTGAEKAIITGPAADRYPVWIPDSDRIVFRSSRNGKDGIWTVRMKDGQTVGEATLIKADAGDFTPIGASRNGSIYYILSQKSSDVYSAAVDPQMLRAQRPPTRLVETYLGRNQLPSWAPSGESFAYYSEREFDNGSKLMIRHADGKEVAAALPVRLTRVAPHWCGIGDLLYSWGVIPQLRIRLFDAGTGEVKLDRRIERPRYSEWNMSPDCQSLYISAYDRNTKRRRVYRQEIVAEKQTAVFEDGGSAAIGPVVSPDGKWLALYGALAGAEKNGVLVLSTAGGALRMLDDAHGSSTYRYVWTPDSKRLMYARTMKRADGQGVENELYWIAVEGGAPRPMGIHLRGASAPSLDSDGKRLLFSVTESSSELWALRNVPLP